MPAITSHIRAAELFDGLLDRRHVEGVAFEGHLDGPHLAIKVDE